MLKAIVGSLTVLVLALGLGACSSGSDGSSLNLDDQDVLSQILGENTAAACRNKADDDEDGFTDCADPDCGGFVFCVTVAPTELTSAQCSDEEDNDEDQKTDCEDPDCAGFVFCQPDREESVAACTDKLDNDGDGVTDCADGGCKGFTFCAPDTEDDAQACKDDKDNDDDGTTDCEDPDCQGFVFCLAPTEADSVTCSDLADNDGDLLTDCADPDCAPFVFCSKGREDRATLCQDGQDNDGDLNTDCQDPDCQGFTFCLPPVENTVFLCGDEEDNDGDDKTDCEDGDCALFLFCQAGREESAAACSDLADNDGDLSIDCEDADCQGFVFCLAAVENTPELCRDGLDNDGDLDSDCQDSDCESLLQCRPAVEDNAALCGDGDDNDHDGDTDCEDSDCLGFVFCNQPSESYAAVCQDNKDNDGDNLVDCADPECGAFLFCLPALESDTVQCRDGKDNDGDLIIDCAETECAFFLFCQPAPEATSEQCSDNLDNDSDGDTDCEDVGCAGLLFCANPTEDNAALCQDNKDNDADGDQDCDDSDCAGFLFCQEAAENTPDLCANGKDDDGDTKTDCDDTQCQAFVFCLPATENNSVDCADAKDNDGDTKVDCLDPDCAGFAFCLAPTEDTSVLCDDTLDNDADTKVDCDDPDCAGFAFCLAPTEATAALCADGKDNDSDTKTDCQDTDCAGFTFCTPPAENTAAKCHNGKDDDGDNDADCVDSDCYGFTFCVLPTEDTALSCDNGSDDDGDLLEDCDDPDCQGFVFCVPGVEDSPSTCQDLTDNDEDGKVDCDDRDCWPQHFCPQYFGGPVTDPWGLTWDGAERSGGTWLEAKQGCDKLGARLPTASEVYRNNCNNRAAFGDGLIWSFYTNTLPLWTATPVEVGKHVTAYLCNSSTYVAQTSDATMTTYRCVYPLADEKVAFDGRRCLGRPGSNCFAVDSVTVIDAYPRPALTYVGASFDCHQEGASLASFLQNQLAVQGGLENGSMWQWLSDLYYVVSDTNAPALLNWSGKGTIFWQMLAWGTGSYGSYAANTAYQFRCAGLAKPDQVTQPAPVETFCRGGCTGGTIKGGTRVLVDTDNRQVSTWYQALRDCRSEGAWLPSAQQIQDLIHGGLANDGTSLWLGTLEYRYYNVFGHEVASWTGSDNPLWTPNAAAAGRNYYVWSDTTDKSSYRCLWRSSLPKPPTCDPLQTLVQVDGKPTCKTVPKGSSAGNAYTGNEVVDDWGYAWDGVQRTAAAFATADSTCKTAGGRLPYPSELYRVNATTGYNTTPVGNASATAYLWTALPGLAASQHTATRISDGGIQNNWDSTALNYRCVWPRERGPILSGHSCIGAATKPCFQTSDGLIVDAGERARMQFNLAVAECTAFGGRLGDPQEYAHLIHEGLRADSSTYHWVFEPSYWYNSNIGHTLARWSTGQTTWSFQTSTGNLSGAGSAYTFRCVYNPQLQ